MKALIVYESYFGNTEKVAKEIYNKISEKIEVKIVNADEVNTENIENADLLIIGSPTRAFHQTQKITKFLKILNKENLKGKRIAVFDTRADMEKVDSKFLKFMVKHFGYAVDSIVKKVKGKSGNTVIMEEWFYVKESEGPLFEGEIEKAQKWAEKIIE